MWFLRKTGDAGASMRKQGAGAIYTRLLVGMRSRKLPDTVAMPCKVLAVCLLGLLALSSACYIQNCPIGGKRAVLDMDMDIRKVRPGRLGDRRTCFFLSPSLPRAFPGLLQGRCWQDGGKEQGKGSMPAHFPG